MGIDYWKEAPAWANYVATDYRGETFYFENEPHACIGVWMVKSGRYEEVTKYPQWRQSLKTRPPQDT
jgi:hypothetical protein